VLTLAGFFIFPSAAASLRKKGVKFMVNLTDTVPQLFIACIEARDGLSIKLGQGNSGYFSNNPKAEFHGPSAWGNENS
jgi:hypothetical protein